MSLYNSSGNSISAKVVGNNTQATEDVSKYLKHAKYMRDMAESTGYKHSTMRPACEVPDIVAIDINNKYGINIHDKFISDQDLRKFLQIMKRDYPLLCY